MSDNNSVMFNSTELTPVIQEAHHNQCPLLLVKDHGLYFMAEKGELNLETGRRLVAYAEGFDPDNVAFEDWYDTLHDICGGDDFAESLASDSPVFKRVLSHQVNIRVEFEDNVLIMTPTLP